MPILTGREVTPDFCAVRRLLESYDSALNVPETRLAVWSWFAGLSTLDEVRADLAATGVPAGLALAAHLGTCPFLSVSRHF